MLSIAFSPPAPLNTNASSDYLHDEYVQVTTDGMGTWVAVWQSRGSLLDVMGPEGGIFLSRSTDGGQTWSAPMDPGWDGRPQVNTDGSGTWIAVWGSCDSLGGTLGGDSDILFSRSTDAGQTWTDPAPLNTNAASDSGQDGGVQVSTDGSGNWVAVWHSDDSFGATIGWDFDLLVSRSTDAGQTWTDPAPLNTNAASDSGSDGHPQVTTDRSGIWVAVWQSLDTLGDTIGEDYDVLVSRSTDAGQTWSDPAPLSSHADSDSGRDWYPQVTTDGANWIAVWSSNNNLGDSIGTDYDVLISRSVDGGQTWTDAAALNANADSDSRSDAYPQVTTDGSGIWVAVWESQDSLGDTIGTDSDILMALSSDAGQTWTPPAALNANADSDSGADEFPQVATDGSGTWVAAWSSTDSLGDTTGGDADVLFATSRFDDFGDQTAFAQRLGLDPSAGALWFRMETTRAGYLTLLAGCDHRAGTTELTLFDADGDQVDASATGSGTERVEIEAAAAGEVYFVKLAGTNPYVDLTVINMLSRAGAAAYVWGTDGDDRCTFDADASRLITVNGVEYRFDDSEVDCLLFMGGAGNDTALFHGSPDDEWVRMSPGTRRSPLTPADYTFATTRVETVTAEGGGGDDTVQMYDSSAPDRFSAGPESAEIFGPGFTLKANHFRWVHAYASPGAVDTASFYDTNLSGTASYDTLFEAKVLADGRHSSRMFTAGCLFQNRALGFELTRAVCQPGGLDVAVLFDSAGADAFDAYADRGTLTYADGTVVQAQNFRYLHAFARNGGLDTATLRDQTTTGAGHAAAFYGRSNSSLLYTGYRSGLIRAWDFDQARVVLSGGDDSVRLYDDPDRVDHLVVPFPGDADHAPAEAKFSNDRRQIYVDDFAWLWATTSQDFEDEADVDPAYADQVILEGNWVEL